jgi:hypothetical protein
MKLNIEVRTLSLSDCHVLKMGDSYDFQVFITDGKRDWFGACRKSLQQCIEMGLAAFKETG